MDGWPRTVRTLSYVAIAVFLVTIAIGIVNGLDLYDFNHDQLLTHVHSGTLGWVTLTLVAASLWVFRSDARRMALALAALIPIYVVAFYVGNLPFRAVAGTALLVAIAWLVVWAWRALRGGSVAAGPGRRPRVLDVRLRGDHRRPAPGPDGERPGAVPGRQRHGRRPRRHDGLQLPDPRRDGPHRVARPAAPGTCPGPASSSSGALFLGGAILAVTEIFLPDQIQAVGGIYLLVELIAIILFAGRILRKAVRVDWLAASPGRHVATAAIFVVVAMLIYMYLVVSFLGNPNADFETFLPILVASDHTSFIGVITNLAFALMFTLAADRRSDWARADQAVYWLMNLGLVVFAIGLAAQVAELKRIGAPIMGIGILLGVAVAVKRLRGSDLSAARDG